MFDNITCKTALPVPKDREELSDINWMTERFQTKDLDCALLEYEIREDGTLWLNGKHIKFTGSVMFYSFFMKEKNDYWVEFMAFFEDGKLMKDIKKSHWSSSCNKDRILQDQRLTNHMKEQRVRLNTVRWRYLFLPWNRFIRWNFKWIHRVELWKFRVLEWIERTLIVD